jgi:serine/threonine protein kinase
MSKLVTNVVATQYESCPPSQLTFIDVLSRRTAYGLIWLGKYRRHTCVAKMIMITTGIHYDKPAQEYRTPDGKKMDEKLAEKYFGHNDLKPFLHMDFRHRRSMTPEAFFKEIDDLVSLGKLGIAPKVYGYGINRAHEIHYGFIVMEKVDCSLKDIYLKRDLHHDEDKIIKGLIDRLHDEHGIIHGDLKPSNIGVYLDANGHIINACFFDCQKIKHKDDYTPEQFKKMAEREADNYKKHIVKNQLEGSKQINA